MIAAEHGLVSLTCHVAAMKSALGRVKSPALPVAYSTAAHSLPRPLPTRVTPHSETERDYVSMLWKPDFALVVCSVKPRRRFKRPNRRKEDPGHALSSDLGKNRVMV